ncbi:MAG: metallophosphoesterase [Anaerolineae bacterium]|nr:metallophosphoesterase [Anaerolineae bacterium]
MVKSSKSQRSRVLLYSLASLVALSMVCSLVSSLVPQRRSTPTRLSVPTATPRLPTLTPRSTSTPRPTATMTVAAAKPPSTTPLPTATATRVAQGQATPIAISDETSFTFAVCGDNRQGDAIYRKILDMVVHDGCAFLVNTGDLVSRGYAYQFKDFQELMKDFPLPFFPAPGNHDSPNGLLTEYLQYSGAPDKHYSFDYGKVHFAVANTTLGEMSPSELEWLDGDLSATEKPVRIVCLHYPPFDPAGTTHVMRSGNEEFMDLMTEHDVKYVFSGHIHSYDHEERDGVTYIITGGAGAPLYPEENREAYYHYVRVTVEGESIETEVVRVEE